MKQLILDYRSFMHSIASCLISLVVITITGFGLEHIMPQDPIVTDSALTAEFIVPAAVHPKPHDKLLFPLVVFVSIGILSLIAMIWRKIGKESIDSRALFIVCFGLASLIALQLGHGPGLIQLFLKPHLLTTIFFLSIGFIASLISIPTSPDKNLVFRRNILIIIFFTIVFLTAFTRVFSVSKISYLPHFASHFEAVIYSIIHMLGVFSGVAIAWNIDTKINEKIGILAENQATLYSESGTWQALPGPSLAEMLLVRDQRQMKEYIVNEGPDKIFINSLPMYLAINPGSFNVSSYYELIDRGPDNRILYFTRRKAKPTF